MHQKKCKGITKISIIKKNKIEQKLNLEKSQQNQQPKQDIEAAQSKSAQPKNNVHRDEKQKECNFWKNSIVVDQLKTQS